MNKIDRWAFDINNLRKSVHDKYFENSLKEVGFCSVDEALDSFYELAKVDGDDNPYRKFPGIIFIYDASTLSEYCFSYETTKIRLVLNSYLEDYLTKIVSVERVFPNLLVENSGLSFFEVQTTCEGKRFLVCSYFNLS